MSGCEVCVAINKFEPIYKTKYWYVGLAPDQAYFGRSYVSAVEHIDTIANLSDEQWADLHMVMKKVERVFINQFEATVLNWCCLTNNAFKTKPYNPHVHWHMRPRYDHKVDIAGINFTDPEFGHHYDRERKQVLNNEEFIKVQEIVKHAFEK